MKEITSKERVLKNIRNALLQKSENPYFDVKPGVEIYVPVAPVIEVAFAEALIEAGGTFIYCQNEEEMASQLSVLIKQRNLETPFCFNKELAELLSLFGLAVNTDQKMIQSMQVGITLSEFLIGRLGSVMVSSVASGGRRTYIYPEVHIVVAYASQVVADIEDALAGVASKYGEYMPSMITLITGPSRTADIEKTLVMGAHGPKELIVLMIDDKDTKK